MDSGASNYITWNNELLTNMKDDKGTPNIKTIGGIAHQVTWKRTLVIPIAKKNEFKKEVLYVFGVNSNLLFSGVLTDKGLGVFFNSQKVFLLDCQQNTVRIGNRELVNGLYKFMNFCVVQR